MPESLEHEILLQRLRLHTESGSAWFTYCQWLDPRRQIIAVEFDQRHVFLQNGILKYERNLTYVD